MNTIKFYKVGDPYGEFSNFSPYGFLLEGEYWPTSEHYFQAQKFENESLQEKIRLMDSPMKAAVEGRNRKNILRKDWEDIKDSVMYKAVYLKFSQNKEIATLLLSTGESELIEHTTNDDYWADGGDGHGKNKLGIILMSVREALRKKV